MADDQPSDKPPEPAIPPEIAARFLLARTQAEAAFNVAIEALGCVQLLSGIVGSGTEEVSVAQALEQLDARLKELLETTGRIRHQFFPPLRAAE